MQQDDLQHRPHELLGQMTRDTLYSSSPQPQENLSATEKPSLELTTANITAMYYAALANLYMQPTLPKTLEEVDAENPRLKIAFNRSYTDFVAARNWIEQNGTEFIAGSTAKSYFDEISDMEKSLIMNIDLFYSR